MTGSSPNIMLVDNKVDNLRLLSSMLATAGFETRPVMSGREALESVAHEAPDLILLDIKMPEMNGFEVCRRLKENPASRDIPVIFLTALTELEDKVRGFAVGGVDYVTKPFQVEEVLARVSSQLELRKARRDLEEAIRKLRELERLRHELTHMIVHDMRTPLTVLLGRLSLMEMEAKGEMADDVRDASQSARMLNEMANTLLDVTRMEEGKMPLTRAPVDLGTLADQVRRSLSRMESGRRIELSTSGDVTASCDGGLIRRVMENLLSNGIKHTPSIGKLYIDVRRVADRVRVAVQDEGEGVPVEARERIFHKFGAAQLRKDRSYHSVGLGLAFCKLAVEAHGSTIGVEAATPRGSVFAFELPQ